MWATKKGKATKRLWGENFNPGEKGLKYFKISPKDGSEPAYLRGKDFEDACARIGGVHSRGILSVEEVKNTEPLKTFKLYFKQGDPAILNGYDFHDACMRVGGIRIADFIKYEEIKEN